MKRGKEKERNVLEERMCALLNLIRHEIHTKKVEKLSLCKRMSCFQLQEDNLQKCIENHKKNHLNLMLFKTNCFCLLIENRILVRKKICQKWSSL